jgi:hypothetical protein
MPCTHYKNALIEAAASSAQAQAELRAHLDACASCRASFEREQALFSSIDAGLQVTVNADVPVSLLPRVRARLDEEESAPRSIWATNWLIFASAAVMVVAFFAARAVWRTNVVQKPADIARKMSVPPRVTPQRQNRDPVVVPPVEKNSVSQQQFAIAKNTSAPETMVRGKTMPEVLVPRDQEVLLAEYAEQWRLHPRAPLLVQDADATVLAPLQVAQIQIAELDVKLLADQKSQ